MLALVLALWRALLIHYATDYISLMLFIQPFRAKSTQGSHSLISNASVKAPPILCTAEKKGTMEYLIDFFSSFMLKIESIFLSWIQFRTFCRGKNRDFFASVNSTEHESVQQKWQTLKNEISNIKERKTFLWVLKSIVSYHIWYTQPSDMLSIGNAQHNNNKKPCFAFTNSL